jgi:polyhydroxyalkanoate synthase
MTTGLAWAADEVAERAARVLAPESDLFEDLDAAGFGAALTRVAISSAISPVGTTAASVRLLTHAARIPFVAGSRMLGRPLDPLIQIDSKDRRFDDPAWAMSPLYYSVRLSYLVTCQFFRELVKSAQVDAPTADKAALAIDLLLDALAPTNFLLTNPAALKRAFDSSGSSLVAGARHFLDDLLHNRGRPRQVDMSGFTVGGNLAATPAKVVYRNELMELLQYEPQTDHVHERPLLCSPPWINKYYVMDLAPERSFIDWAVQHGRTVFAISYKNPSSDMSATTMEDYLIKGPRAALEVIRDITGVRTVDIVGLCLGGAMTAITAAYLRQAGDYDIGALTLLNTMLDYADPGVLAAFTDKSTIERLERKMKRQGTLDDRSMAGTFDVLRANDLIFNYVVSNWLMGQDPPAFDILAWNADRTRMPAAMHSFYLRHFYGENRLASGTLEIAGTTINLSSITSPVYVVSAINDHIVPWESAYRTVNLMGGPARFVLGNGGHIAGIVSPPTPKAWHRVVESDGKLPDSAQDWLAASERRRGSWWEDWAGWSAVHAGPMRTPPPIGSDAHPVLADGPGRYVFS